MFRKYTKRMRERIEDKTNQNPQKFIIINKGKGHEKYSYSIDLADIKNGSEIYTKIFRYKVLINAKKVSLVKAIIPLGWESTYVSIPINTMIVCDEPAKNNNGLYDIEKLKEVQEEIIKSIKESTKPLQIKKMKLKVKQLENSLDNICKSLDMILNEITDKELLEEINLCPIKNKQAELISKLNELEIKAKK